MLQGPLPRARLLVSNRAPSGSVSIRAEFRPLTDYSGRCTQLRIQGSQTDKDDEKTIQDPELLMEMMGAREEVDATDDEAALQGMLARSTSSIEECVQELSAAFKAADSSASVKLTQRLTYLMKIQEEIKRKL